MDLIFTQLKYLKGNDFRNQVRITGHLGSGNNRVYEVQYNDITYAMKEVIVKQEQEMENEVQILQALLKHNFVIKFIDYMLCEEVQTNSVYSQNHFISYIIMEKGHMCLTKYVESLNGYLHVNDMCNILDQLVYGFESLQQAHVAHRDIKPQNILVMGKNQLQLKVCDVGSCTRFDQNKSLSVVGTISFQSPELFYSNGTRTNSNPFKSDVFSLGLCILYVITFQKWLQKGRSHASLPVYTEVIAEWIQMADRICAKNIIISTILKQMLQIDPEKRPDFIELKLNLDQLKKKQLESMMVQKQPTIIVKPSYESDSPAKNNATESQFFQRTFSKTIAVPFEKKRQYSTTNLQVNQNQKKNQSRSPSREQKDSKEPNRPPSNLIRNGSQRKLESYSKSSYKVSQFGGQLSATPLKREKSAQKKLQTDISQDQLVLSRVLEPQNPKLVYYPSEQGEMILNEETLVSCDYMMARQFKDVKYLSLDDKQKQSKQVQIGNNCVFLNLKIYANTHGIVVSSANVIETLIVEIYEENPYFGDSLSKLKLGKLSVLEIHNYSNNAQIERMIQIISSLEVNSLSLSILGALSEQDHKALMQKLSKLKCKSLKFIIPNNKLYLQQTGQQWQFNGCLEQLHLDYSRTGISSVIGSLFSALRTLQLRSFYLDITQCFSQAKEICLLFDYLITKPLQHLTLILDHMHQFDAIIVTKLAEKIPQIGSLQNLSISLGQVKMSIQLIEIMMQLFDRLAQNKIQQLSLKIDRIVDKGYIKQIKEATQYLKSYKMNFLMNNQGGLQIIFYIKYRIDTSLAKCNQGQAISCSKMYVCIPCTMQHQLFLGHPVYICNLCIHLCHDKLDKVQIVNKTNNDKKRLKITDPHIESQTLENRCFCNMIGMCKLDKNKKCHRNKGKQIEMQLAHLCKQCDQKICTECRECHLQHEVSEMYVHKFQCQCDRMYDIFND